MQVLKRWDIAMVRNIDTVTDIVKYRVKGKELISKLHLAKGSLGENR